MTSSERKLLETTRDQLTEMEHNWHVSQKRISFLETELDLMDRRSFCLIDEADKERHHAEAVEKERDKAVELLQWIDSGGGGYILEIRAFLALLEKKP